MANFLSDTIDFTQYLKETDSNTNVKAANLYIPQIKERMRNISKEKKLWMPWEKANESFYYRTGEMTVYAGMNGHGKSQVTAQIAMHLMKQGEKVCMASFEMKPKRSIYRMIRQFSGENIDKPRYMDKAKYVTEMVERFRDFSSNHLWFYDQQGTTNASQVIAMARYCAVKLQITHIFIDSLMKCVPSEDDYNAQKYFVDELTALARDHNVHVHLVHHIRKLSSEEITPNKNDIKGTGAIGLVFCS